MSAGAISTTVDPAPPSTELDVATCWTQIGVYGNGQCARLDEFVHCRNCPVYSDAALQLLDRPLPDDYRQAWTTHFAVEDKPAPQAKSSALLFRVHSEWLGLPVQAFQEVAERRQIHSLPHRRQGLVLGLTNVRGELLICVALARLLGIERPAAREAAAGRERLLVVNWEGQRLVFPVDEVHGIQRFHAQDLKEPPATVAKSGANFSQGVLAWQDRTVGFLNAPALFLTLNRSLS